MELEQKIKELQDRRWNLRKRMNAIHDPFVLKFPPEIASHIFVLSMEEWDYEPNYISSKKLPMPFILGTVCWGWRQLARSTAKLWSTLSFTLGKRTNSEIQLRVVSDWLQLSGSLPLTFLIANLYPSSQETDGPVISLLNQHSRRWRKVSLHLPTHYFALFCGTSPPSNLCSLKISNTSTSSLNNSNSLSPTFRIASTPNLTDLVVENFDVLALDITWDNITRLSLGYITLERCIEAIRRAPLLEFCSLSKIVSNPSVPNTIIRCMRLRKLELLCLPVVLRIAFMDMMELPSLEEYHYQSQMGRDESDIMADSMISLLNRSGCFLKQLKLRMDHKMNVEDLKKLLDAIPSLQNLHLELLSSNGLFVTDSLLQDLSPPIPMGGIPTFLPHLRSLTLPLMGKESRMWECIPRIYSWPPRKLLRLSLDVRAYSSRAIDQGMLDKILQLIDEGIDIRILKYGQDYLPQMQFRQGI